MPARCTTPQALCTTGFLGRPPGQNVAIDRLLKDEKAARRKRIVQVIFEPEPPYSCGCVLLTALLSRLGARSAAPSVLLANLNIRLVERPNELYHMTRQDEVIHAVIFTSSQAPLSIGLLVVWTGPKHRDLPTNDSSICTAAATTAGRLRGFG